MDYQELDEEEKARRKADVIKRRKLNKNSRLFMVGMSIFEIIVTLAIIIVLFLALAFVMFRLFKATGPVAQIVFEVLSIIIFIGGMVLGFFVYKAFAKWVIKKYNLYEKINKDVLEHYKSKEEQKKVIDELRR